MPRLAAASVATAALAGGAAVGPALAQAGLPEAQPALSPMANLKETLSQRVINEPAQTSRIVQDWLKQR